MFDSSGYACSADTPARMSWHTHISTTPTTREVLDAASTKPYGFTKFNPSVGIGGHCIPVDPNYLLAAAQNAGANFRFIELANEVNLDMPKNIVNRIVDAHGGSITMKKIIVLGVAYKPNIADTRETPVERLINELRLCGAEVVWHDPLVGVWRTEESVDLNSKYDIAILATAHDLLIKINPSSFADYVFDCSGRLQNAVQL